MEALKLPKHRHGIVLAVAGMWLFGAIGGFLLIHFTDWWFLGLHGHDAITLEEIGAFYLAWTGSQLPAAAFAGMIIVCSDFIHPVRTTFLTVTAFQLVFSMIRAIHWPWQAVRDFDRAVPILAYLLSVSFLIGFSVLVAWLMPIFHKFVSKYFGH